MLSVDLISISETPVKSGLLFSIMQPNGEIETSQLGKAKGPSLVMSGEAAEGW